MFTHIHNSLSLLEHPKDYKVSDSVHMVFAVSCPPRSLTLPCPAPHEAWLWCASPTTKPDSAVFRPKQGQTLLCPAPAKPDSAVSRITENNFEITSFELQKSWTFYNILWGLKTQVYSSLRCFLVKKMSFSKFFLQESMFFIS